MKLALRGPRSILVYTMFLVMGVVVAVALASVALILLRPPPRNAPLTAYEVARLLDNRPIAKDAEVNVSTSAVPPRIATNSDDAGIRDAIARSLDLPLFDVEFERPPAPAWLNALGARPGDHFKRQIDREMELYGGDGQFNPVIFGSFRAARKLSDGGWRTLSRDTGDPLERWQVGTVQWILISVLLAFPFAWLFSRRIARPIKAFARAAERIGRHQQVEQVALAGPTEIRLAAGALNEMQARLARYVNERTSVVGAIAHDMRTPLSRLNFHLETAPEGMRQKAAKEIAEMEQMIQATLEFVQNETRSQPSEPIHLSLLVEGVVDDLSDLGHDVRLMTSVDAVVLGDAVLLKRLFANLIMNAVTYGNRAEVTVSIAGEIATVAVEDEGPGLNPSDLSRVFEPFYRAESSRNRATGGIGLGLAIVQTATRAHGGEVTLENRPAGGLCARITLPLARV